MTGHIRLLAAAACLLPAACATPGGGPLGIVMFDPDQHVSGAEPLWGKQDQRFFDDPSFLLSMVSTEAPSGRKWPEICGQIVQSIRGMLPVMTVQKLDSGPRYTALQRNEVIDGIMAASDRKCGRYIAFLQQYDGNVNSTFGIASQAAAILATIASGGTAQGLAAAAGIAGGVRGTLNESHFSNQTIGVVANAFENVRREQREAIAKLQVKDAADYTLMRGIQDATRYHASCTIVTGLKEAQRNVEEARSPNLDTMQKMIDKLNELRGGMRSFLDQPAAAPVQADGTPATPSPAPGAGASQPDNTATPIPG
jgi:hypothetical protein